jgi:uncharacterized damage-inducible protein DinB
MNDLLADLRHEYQRHKAMADRAMAELGDEEFFRRPGELVNPIALIVKHLAGNFASRWTDFLTTDGDKPTRDRDREFVLTDEDTRANLMAAWERGWRIFFDTLDGLTDADLSATVTIRGEPHSALQALLRGATHLAYHTGQILYLARLLRPESTWQTIPPGQSRDARGAYRKPPGP